MKLTNVASSPVGSIAEVMGSNSVYAYFFFQAFILITAKPSDLKEKWMPIQTIIYSKGLEFLVAVHTSSAKFVKRQLCVHKFWRSHGNVKFHVWPKINFFDIILYCLQVFLQITEVHELLFIRILAWYRVNSVKSKMAALSQCTKCKK